MRIFNKILIVIIGIILLIIGIGVYYGDKFFPIILFLSIILFLLLSLPLLTYELSTAYSTESKVVSIIVSIISSLAIAVTLIAFTTVPPFSICISVLGCVGIFYVLIVPVIEEKLKEHEAYTDAVKEVKEFERKIAKLKKEGVYTDDLEKKLAEAKSKLRKSPFEKGD